MSANCSDNMPDQRAQNSTPLRGTEPARSRPLGQSHCIPGATQIGVASTPRGNCIGQVELTRSLPPEPKSRNAEGLSVRAQLHQRLLNKLDEAQLMGAEEEVLVKAVRDFVTEVLNEGELRLNEAERRRLAEDLIQEMIGVGPLAPLMADPAITDILVNGPSIVYVERFGKLEQTDIRFRDNAHLVRIIQRIAARVGRRIDEASPMVDARLADGSRVNATLPPISLDGPTLSIRRFGQRRLQMSDLVRMGMLAPAMCEFLDVSVKARRNIIISGGTGAGKSTFLGALAESIPDAERIITIEDAAELILQQSHVIRMETRPPNLESQGRIGARELVINALRMRPDRIIVGEVRSSEALDMLQAMNTGHDGSMTTIHANSPRDAMARLETMVLMAGVELPSRAIREQIVAAVDLIVQVRRFEDGVRRIDCMTEVLDLEGNVPQTQDIFKFERRGRRGRTIEGEFAATGVAPRLMQIIRERNLNVSMDWFSN